MDLELSARADARWMRRALELAALADHRTSPNPMVGAVVLDGAGMPAGEGYHRAAGEAHAEVEALARAGARARGGTLYVNLEPCAHQGRTPPCADAVVAAGVRRVVAAMVDPNPAVQGAGFERLAAAGIEVTSGLMEDEARRLNAFFCHHVTTGRPFVSVKFAMSLDGKIATSTGKSRWISGDGSRRLAHRLRHAHDAVLVGVNTVLADDPILNVRELPPGDPAAEGGGPRQPLRVVADSSLRTPPAARVLTSAGGAGPALVATTAEADPGRVEELRRAGVEVEVLPATGRPAGMAPGPGSRSRVDLAALLDLLGRRGVGSLLVEGGAEIHGSLFSLDLVDRLYAFISPRVIGGAGAPGPVAGAGFAELEQAVRLGEMAVSAVGEDILVTADVHGHS